MNKANAESFSSSHISSGREKDKHFNVAGSKTYAHLSFFFKFPLILFAVRSPSVRSGGAVLPNTPNLLFSFSSIPSITTLFVALLTSSTNEYLHTNHYLLVVKFDGHFSFCWLLIYSFRRLHYLYKHSTEAGIRKPWTRAAYYFSVADRWTEIIYLSFGHQDIAFCIL